MAQTLAEGIPGAALQVLAGAAHLSVLEQPAEFAAAARNFLGGLPRNQ